MESRVKLAGHPVHPMLIVFPLGLLSTAVLFDIVFLVTAAVRWTELAYYMIGAGVVGGAAAAIPGWVDWAAIPSGTRAKRVGLLHGAGNVVVLALFVLSWLLRRPDPSSPPTGAIVAGVLGVVVVAITGWLGGELVGRLGVAVDEGAHLDAPSSLSALPAALEAHGASRAAMSAGYTGRERRAYPQPAYAGMERRTRAAAR
jgi:uncharacterized membrane protein